MHPSCFTGCPVPLPRALRIALAITWGLQELHYQGQAMCCLKPGNVLLGPRGAAGAVVPASGRQGWREEEDGVALADVGFEGAVIAAFKQAHFNNVQGVCNYM